MTVTSASQDFTPVQMIDLELTEPLPRVSYDGRHTRVWVLGRLHTEPIGVCVVSLDRGDLTPDQLGALIWPEFREPVTRRFAAARLPRPSGLAGGGLDADPATLAVSAKAPGHAGRSSFHQRHYLYPRPSGPPAGLP